MRILLVADSTPRPSLFSMYEKYKPDLLLCLGDLDSMILKDAPAMKIPKLGIYGNHCGQYMEEHLLYPGWPDLEIINIHRKRITIGNYEIYGLEGCPIYKKDALHQYERSQVATWLENAPPPSSDKKTIFISHTPPMGIHDEQVRSSHTGWKALYEWIEKYQPDYVFHGHTSPEYELDSWPSIDEMKSWPAPLEVTSNEKSISARVATRMGDTTVKWVWKAEIIDIPD